MNMVQRLAWIILWFLYLSIRQFAVADSRIPIRSGGGHIYRSWSEWTSWSSCSRSCESGVSVRTRICRTRWMYHNFPGITACLGETTEYKICVTQMCPPLAEDFLTHQCKQHNGHIIGGKAVHEWLPRRNVDNPCELQCLGKGEQIVYSFGKVTDGSRCDSFDGPAICVNGRCTTIDCAGQLGTDNRVDMCGVCAGDNSTCVKYRNSYWGHPRSAKSGTGNTDDHYDYNRIVSIPPGATRVLVKEASDTNFLVLMDHRGVIFINGNWRVGPPGSVVAGGTSFVYNRSLDGQETLSAPGPTKKELYILVLGKGDVPTVHYEYWFSKKSESLWPKATTSPLKKSFQHFSKIKEANIPPEKHSKLNDQKYQRQHSLYKHTVRYEGYPSYYDRNKIVPLRLQPGVGGRELPQAEEEIVTLRKKETTWIDNSLSLTSTTEISPLKSRVIASPSKEKFEAVKYRYHLKAPKQVPVSNVSFAPTIPAERLSRIPGDQENSVLGVTTRSSATSEFSGKHTGAILSYLEGFRRRSRKMQRRQEGRQRDSEKIRKSNSQPSPQNDAKPKSISRRKKKTSQEGNCLKCPRSKHQKKNFCNSDFVLRASVLETKRLERETRYEVEVIQSYKNLVPILTREYLWTKDHCRCPRLRVGKEYILMGNSVGISGSRETRLFLDGESFVKKYNRKRSMHLVKMAGDRDVICRSKT